MTASTENRRIVVIVLVFALCVSLFAVVAFTRLQPFQTTTTHSLAMRSWSQNYEGVSGAGTFVQTPDLGFALAATSADREVLLIRTNESRSMIWQKTFGEGFGNAVISTADGGFVVAGARLSGDGDDAVNSSLLVKTDVEGNVLWSKEYEGNGFTGVVNVTDGGYVMLGTFNVNSTVAPCLMKVDAEGNLQWTHTYSRSEADAVKLYTLVATSDGGYAMAGEIQYTTNGGLVRQGWLVKTAPNGDVEVSRPFSMDGWTVFYSLAQANDGGFMLAGATANASDVPYSACLLRTDSDGHSLWSRINATSNDVHGFTEDGLGYQLYSLAKFSNGNYVVTGYSSQNLFTVEIFKDTGDVLQRESSGGSALTRTMTYVTPVAQGVFAPGYAYISYSNGSIHFTEEYSYVPED